MSLWLLPDPLILASKSEPRKAMLTAAGLPIESIPAEVDERAIETASGLLAPADVAALLACEKAKAVSAQRPGRVVVGADQTLALGSQRFSKPADRESARAQLRALRHQTHELHSAVAVVRNRDVLFSHAAVARLTMRNFSDRFLDAYLAEAGDTVTQSVGGYQLEKFGIQLFERIEGDHFTILGLPLLPLLQGLRRLQFVAH